MNRKDRRASKSQGGLQDPALQALFEQALAHHQAGNLAAAEPLYRHILEIEPRHDGSIHFLGLIAYQRGQPAIAIDLIRQAIRLNGRVSSYHNNLGLALNLAGQHADAVVSFRRALALAPDDPECLNNMGVALENYGKFDEALAAYNRALGARADYASALYNKGNVFRRLGRMEEAVTNYERALAVNPHYVEAWDNCGAALQALGRWQDAAVCCERALALKPDNIAALVNFGNICRALEKPEEALPHYRRALAIKPDYADAYNNLGLALVDLGRFEEAVAACERALALTPRAEIYNNLGTALEEQRNFAAAEEQYRRALALDPACAEAYYNLGNAAQKQGRLDEAVSFYEQAIILRPAYVDARWNGAFIRLLRGDFAAGWRESEWRWRRKGVRPPVYDAPLWDGGPLNGKTILLHCEQGLGDSIQFIRYARILKEKGARVLLLCPPALARLFETAGGIDRIIPEGDALPVFDCYAPLLSLPGLVGTHAVEDISAAVPYLQADPARVAQWHDRLAAYPGFKIGVVWRGNPHHKNDRNRSATPADYADFLTVPAVVTVNLQKDAREEEIAALGAGSLFNAAPDLQDFTDTAALIAALDLVISVDTSVCHLAGALAKPVWTLLPFAPDWRWLLAPRDDSPWYPTMKIFRQPAPGDWAAVAADVKAALSRRAQA